MIEVEMKFETDLECLGKFTNGLIIRNKRYSYKILHTLLDGEQYKVWFDNANKSETYSKNQFEKFFIRYH